MDRSPQNGFRCVYYPEPESIPETALGLFELLPVADLRGREPVSDKIFERYRQQFAYERTDTSPQIEQTEDGDAWTHERLTYDAAYDGERIIGHLFLPRNVAPPYQTVIYFPGSGSLFHESSTDIESYFEFSVFLSHIVSNGRAVLYPVYKGTFERKDMSLASIHSGAGSGRYSEFVVKLVQDVSRSIDYLETREDIDLDRLAYYGMSWGGMLGVVIPAVEDRFRTSVLLSGGMANLLEGKVVRFPPEADPLNYVSRVELPTLMINGRYDMLLPLDEAIRPMYEMLGTPEEHKKLLLYDTDHIPPRTEFIKETLAWLDLYLGPVGNP